MGGFDACQESVDACLDHFDVDQSEGLSDEQVEGSSQGSRLKEEGGVRTTPAPFTRQVQ
jgi:hypothetical protein